MKQLRTILIKLKEKSFKSQSIFVKTFVMLMLLSLMMVLSIGIWMNGITARNHRLQVAQSNLSRLQQTGETMKITVQSMGQTMSQIMWSDDFITYMLLPYSYHYNEDSGLMEKNTNMNQTRDYRMVRQLVSAVEGNDLVKKAFFYSELSRIIYDDRSFIRDGELYEDWGIIEDHCREIAQTCGTVTESTTILLYQGRLFVLEDMKIPNYLGTMVFELNVDMLAQTLGLLDEEGVPAVYVYTQEHEPVFSSCYSYDSIEPKWDNTDQFISSGNVNAAEDMTKGYYQYFSSKTGWSYLIPMDTDMLSIRSSDILPMYLPISLLFLVISSAFAFYISRSIYRPINRLMNLVAQSGGGRKPREDAEVDFLEAAFSNAIDRQDQLKGIMQSIGPEVLDSMLKNLMVGKKLSEKRVAEILYGVGNPLPLQGRFVVLACRMDEPDDRPVTDTEINLYLLFIRNLAAGLENSSYQIYDIRAERLGVGLILSFSEGETAVSMKKVVTEIQQKLLQESKCVPYKLHVEKSGIYQSLLDIRLAYQEAHDKLLYQEYLQSDQSSEENENEEDCCRLLNRRYYQERMSRVADVAAQGDTHLAEQTVRLVLAEIGQDNDSLEEYCKRVEEFLDELTEKVISLPLSVEDQQTLDSYRNISEKLKIQSSREAMEPYIMEYSRVLIRMIRFYSSKNRYKYVDKAKEYLVEHYADSNLSLNEVGEYIGISGSYLSELFNEITGEKFSGYLASFRVEKAKQLLKSTNVTIKEIGFLCGFNSIQNFIRVFKKCAGVTPGQFREGL